MYVNYYPHVNSLRAQEHLAEELERTRHIQTMEIDAEDATTLAITHEHILKYACSKLNRDMIAFYAFLKKEYSPFADHAEELYTTFRIPKASGGTREIKAPIDELKCIQKEFTRFMHNDCKLIYHDAVHSFTRKRNCKTALLSHQERHARWFLKLDIHDFFGSCTKELVLNSLKCLPNTYWLVRDDGAVDLLDLCFLNNVLPQGAPSSPMLSNIVLQEFDTKIYQALKEQGFHYTRYADDILISKNTSFQFQPIVELVEQLLPKELQLNKVKTRYGSCNGANWNLGLMYNKDLALTVGHRNKHTLQCMFHNLYRDYPEDCEERREKLMQLNGLLAYYEFIEPDYFSNLRTKLKAKGYATKS